MIAKAVLVLFFAGAALAYSGGAPKEVCGDMKPQHPVDPKKTPLPYKVTVDKDAIAAGEKVKITISGDKAFKGYMLQVRDGETPSGTFHIPEDDRYSKTVDCSGKHVRYANIFDKKMQLFMKHFVYMINSVASRIVPYDLTRLFFRDDHKHHTAATHKNSASKNNLVLEWSPSDKAAKTYTVYATVAEDGGVFWVRKPTAKITVK